MKKLISDKRLSYRMTIMVSCDPVVRLAHQVVAEFFGSRVAKVTFFNAWYQEDLVHDSWPVDHIQSEVTDNFFVNIQTFLSSHM